MSDLDGLLCARCGKPIVNTWWTRYNHEYYHNECGPNWHAAAAERRDEKVRELVEAAEEITWRLRCAFPDSHVPGCLCSGDRLRAAIAAVKDTL